MKIPNIWVTVGKRGFNEQNIQNLIKYNIAGIRINTGRSSYPWIYNTIDQITKYGYPLENIMLDIGNTKPRLSLKDKKGLVLKVGETFVVSDREKGEAGAWLENPLFFKEICKNDIVYFGDGEIESIVEKIDGNKVLLRALTEGILGEAISIGIKGKSFFHFDISEKEIGEVNSLLETYPIKIILSFVEKSRDIKWAQERFPKAVSIIPKIETFSAVDEIDDILGLSDYIFIGRGDLALSMGIEQIGIIQKKLVEKAHKAGCKVSVGTGTLDSLKWSEIPLRAEIIDITNSCVTGVDTIALTSETGGSKSPFKAIDYLKKVLDYLKTVEV